jgi:hypothetical protein
MRTLHGALALAALLGACIGEIGDQANAPRPEGVPAAPLCTAVDPGASPLRRLTAVEYDRSVQDLLGVDAGAVAGWPAEGGALGFDNEAANQHVTLTHATQFMTSAEGAAASVAKNLAALVPCDPAKGEHACAQAFLEDLAGRAYRRPLANDERARLDEIYLAGAALGGFADGVRLAVTAILQSPHFLYRVELAAGAAEGTSGLVRLSDHEIATRLSYLLWRSTPDAELRSAADTAALSTPEQIAAQAVRMLADPRASQGLDDFHRQWLGLDALASADKDPAAYPGFDATVRASLRDGTLAFARALVLEGGRFRDLFTATFGFASALTAPILGVMAPTSGTLERVELPPGERAGIVTDPSWLAARSHFDQSSPVRRGVFVRERLLCQSLPQPPDDVEIMLPEPDPTLTTRERFAAHTAEPLCKSCHVLIDPLGFGFEHYDAVGRWRATENGLPIDAAGEVFQTDDMDGPFDGALALAAKLAESTDVRACYLTQWFRYAAGRAEDAEDACTLAEMDQRLSANGDALGAILLSIVTSDAFRHRHPVAADPEVCTP